MLAYSGIEEAKEASDDPSRPDESKNPPISHKIAPVPIASKARETPADQ